MTDKITATIGYRNGGFFMVDVPKSVRVVIRDYDYSKFTDPGEILNDEQGDSYHKETLEEYVFLTEKPDDYKNPNDDDSM